MTYERWRSQKESEEDRFKWLCEEIRYIRYDYQRLVKELHQLIEERHKDEKEV